MTGRPEGDARYGPHAGGIATNGGRYFEDCNEAPVVQKRATDGVPAGVADYALDPEGAERLWDVSERLLASG